MEFGNACINPPRLMSNINLPPQAVMDLKSTLHNRSHVEWIVEMVTLRKLRVCFFVDYFRVDACLSFCKLFLSRIGIAT